MFGKNKYEIIRILINYGDINHKNNDGISGVELIDYIIEFFENDRDEFYEKQIQEKK